MVGGTHECPTIVHDGREPSRGVPDRQRGQLINSLPILVPELHFRPSPYDLHGDRDVSQLGDFNLFREMPVHPLPH